MLSLQPKQIASFEKSERNKFVQKTVVFLKYNYYEWTQGKSDKELEQYVESMIALGKKYEIYKEINIQKLLFLNRQFPFALPLTFAHRNVLMEEGLDEDSRIKQFYKSLLGF